MAPRLMIGLGLAALGLIAMLARWLLARVGALVDEMVKQDYESLAERLGDVVVWLAARHTASPHDRFEEWMGDLLSRRAATGRPCLPDALWLYTTARRVRSRPQLPPRRAPARPLDPDFGATVLDQIFTHWVDPDLRRRGLPTDRATILSAVVVMAPGQPIEVRLNDEAQWIAKMHAKRAMQAGDAVTVEDVDPEPLELRPADIDGNAGWTGFVSIGSNRHIAFDFRRNRATAHELLDQAASHLGRAHLAIGRAAKASAVRELNSAADLSVLAQLYLHEDDPPADPSTRRARHRTFARLGNVPESHSRCLDDLAALDVAAPRALTTIALRRRELRRLESTVSDMIELARATAGELS